VILKTARNQTNGDRSTQAVCQRSLLTRCEATGDGYDYSFDWGMFGQKVEPREPTDWESAIAQNAEEPCLIASDYLFFPGQRETRTTSG
jgi:hypothetical protein